MPGWRDRARSFNLAIDFLLDFNDHFFTCESLALPEALSKVFPHPATGWPIFLPALFAINRSFIEE